MTTWHPEGQPRSNLAAQYTLLDTTILRCNGLIPAEGFETIDRKQVRNFGNATGTHIRETLERRFPDTTQQGQIVGALNRFLGHVTSNMSWTDENSQLPFGQLNEFLIVVPENMLDRLGQQATPATITAILNVGTSAIKKLLAENPDLAENSEDWEKFIQKEYITLELGRICSLVGEVIPDAVAQAGEKGSALVAEMEEVAHNLPFKDFAGFVKYYQTSRVISDRDRLRIAEFETLVRRVDPRLGENISPFNEPRQPWKKERGIRYETRPPTWADLGEMIRSTEEDNIEYGISINRKSADLADEEYRLRFLRGSTDNIFNGDNEKIPGDKVFFHAHPSTNREKELTAPLVSRGDITANLVEDYGGGYLNVACTSGVTLHAGSSVAEGAQVGESRNNLNSIYTIESGQYQGEIISGNSANYADIVEGMLKLKRSGLPFAYSIFDKAQKIKYWFIHIPWEYIDHDVSFQDVCFGDGLPRLLSRLDRLPELPNTQNLYQALIHSKQLSLAKLKKMS